MISPYGKIDCTNNHSYWYYINGTKMTQNFVKRKEIHHKLRLDFNLKLMSNKRLI